MGSSAEGMMALKSLQDMIDGGGFGASGPKFEGGGLISEIANMFATPYGSKNAAPMTSPRPQGRPTPAVSTRSPAPQYGAPATLPNNFGNLNPPQYGAPATLPNNFGNLTTWQTPPSVPPVTTTALPPATAPMSMSDLAKVQREQAIQDPVAFAEEMRRRLTGQGSY